MVVITVTVELDNFLVSLAGKKVGRQSVLQFPEPVTIRDLLVSIGLPRDTVSFAAVNGERKGLDCFLQNNDRVALFPYIIGG